ncbi:hypothetical protein [Pseudoalteromonas rubra]|uniref:Uncharacterized protein n=1 Tax=Pseudoalteromonas rubra TaxID=43658 RepID=A0A0U3HX43_9GAMM|nr:hypothetical protein [Pseudoalteromonas rubra]ALU46169.1 hypothetical protein AT705_24715 [Pseudoalteromonas rubra]
MTAHSYDSTAPDSAYPGQDASYGRDAAGEPDLMAMPGSPLRSWIWLAMPYPVMHRPTAVCWTTVRGYLGKKISAPGVAYANGEALRKHLESVLSGNAYPYHAQNANWRAANYRYFWYDANNASNGGAPGAQGEIFTNMRYPISNICAFPNKESISYSPLFNRCDTTVYAKAMNDLAVCGLKTGGYPVFRSSVRSTISARNPIGGSRQLFSQHR